MSALLDSVLPPEKLADAKAHDFIMTPHARLKAHLKAALEEAKLCDEVWNYATELDAIETLLEEMDDRERINWAEARRER